MSTRSYNVLFLCTGNSARSVMGESILNQAGQGRFKAYSAGSHPAGTVHAQTLALLQRNGYPTEGLHSKSWDGFAQPDAPVMDFVLTVCDKAAGEVCPVWPGQPISAHWGVADPADAKGSDEDVQRAFITAFVTLKSRIDLLLNLSLEKLDRLSIKQELDGIARARP